MAFDFTPVTLNNPPRFAEQVEALAEQYAALKPILAEAIALHGKLGSGTGEKHDSERVHRLGTAIERLDDAMPNTINALRLFSEEPTVGGQDNLIRDHWQRQKYTEQAGQLIDNASRELSDPDGKARLKQFDEHLHDLFHQVERCRPQAVGPRSAAASVPKPRDEDIQR